MDRGRKPTVLMFGSGLHGHVLKNLRSAVRDAGLHDQVRLHGPDQPMHGDRVLRVPDGGPPEPLKVVRVPPD